MGNECNQHSLPITATPFTNHAVGDIARPDDPSSISCSALRFVALLVVLVILMQRQKRGLGRSRGA
jgi:hypothetical protein